LNTEENQGLLRLTSPYFGPSPTTGTKTHNTPVNIGCLWGIAALAVSELYVFSMHALQKCNRVQGAAKTRAAMKTPTTELSTADVCLLIHACKAYSLQARRDPRLANDVKAFATKVQALYPDAEKGGAR
jgi:hypothetical protein